jgi:small-conductance mechanosensitive channel
MTTAPNAAPKNIAAIDSSLLANLGLLPFASEESAPMPVIVSVRTVVVRYRQAWKKLVVRLLIVVLIVGLLFGMNEISRRLALGRIQDPNRRRVISMVHRLLTMFAIAVVALFSVASDLSSLATYFGLLSAGLLLALQNVILASLGSLLLLGKRGIRVGDRVQVSGITGDVINMGLLQFQLREFDLEEGRFTGHVATFSNFPLFLYLQLLVC